MTVRLSTKLNVELGTSQNVYLVQGKHDPIKGRGNKLHCRVGGVDDGRAREAPDPAVAAGEEDDAGDVAAVVGEVR